MRSIKVSKSLAGIALAFGSVALLAGCHSTRSESELYTQPAMGASGSSAYSGSSSGASSATTSEFKETVTETGQGDVAIPLYEEQLIVGTRTTDSGGVRLHKQVTTETVSQPVQVQRQTVTVKREAAPAGQAMSQDAGKQAGKLGAPFEEGEIVIKLQNQEPVVETRIVPSGKVVVQTRTSTEQMNVQRQVRREKIGVDKIGDPQNVIISEELSGQSKEAVGAAPAGSQEIKGSQSKEGVKTPVTTDENQGFPRPQPDGKDTFPELNKNPDNP
jgi:stress response protein YsnF